MRLQMKTLKNIIRWFLFAFMLFMALGCAALSAPIAAIMFIVTGVICSPICNKMANSSKQKSKIRGIIGVVLFCVSFGILVGTADTSSSENVDEVIYEPLEESVDKTSDESYRETRIENIETELDAQQQDMSESLENVNAEESSSSSSESNEKPNQISELQVHYIDVGQGDATLIICGSEAMLIDAGDNSKGTTVQLYLQKQGVKSLKYMIGTHPDADHIGGMDVIITKFDCETIIMPDKTSDTATYRDVIDAMEYKYYKNTLPVVGDTYTLGDASFTIIAPNKSYSDSNNSSVVILLTHGSNKFLFTGDAEFESENDILNNGINISANVLKVGHHGSSTSTGQEFLKAVNPQYAVISCGKDNSYGHPHEETLTALKNTGVQVYRTDEQGSIVATSDGKSIIWNTEPSNSWKAGETEESNQSSTVKTNDDKNSNSEAIPQITPQEPVIESVPEEPIIDSAPQETVAITPEVPASTITYVLNNNTKKFHYPSCSSVDQIKPINREDTTMTREEIIAQGYDPCKRCNP